MMNRGLRSLFAPSFGDVDVIAYSRGSNLNFGPTLDQFHIESSTTINLAPSSALFHCTLSPETVCFYI